MVGFDRRLPVRLLLRTISQKPMHPLELNLTKYENIIITPPMEIWNIGL